MKIIFILFLFINFCFSEDTIVFEKMYNDKKLKYANEAIPLIIEKNKKILNERKFLLTPLIDEYPNTFMSKKYEIEKLEKQKIDLYKKYLINPKQSQKILDEEVKNKVAPLNLNLILAHMMYESNFGSKEIANKGYNFFNIMTKSKRFDNFYKNNDVIFTIKYKNVEDSINHYYELINSYPFGKNYREIRKNNFNSFDLLKSLNDFYPENTSEHLKNIENILINDFKLDKKEKNDFEKAKEYSNFVYLKFLEKNNNNLKNFSNENKDFILK